MIALSHAKPVQWISNVLLLRKEYGLWILSYFNTKLLMKIAHISHFKTFPQFLRYGCNVALIVPYRQKIIYIYHKIYNSFPNILDKQSCIIKIMLFEIEFQKMLS